MDWTKTLEKFSVFIAALIPGSAVLLVTALRRPDFWMQFWNLNYLGYQTKIAVLIFVAFSVGFTANVLTFILNYSVSFSIGFVGGVKVGYKKARKKADVAVTASNQESQEPTQQQPQLSMPWRSQNWRKLLTTYLGSAAPADIALSEDPELSNDELWKEWWNLLYRLVTPKNDRQTAMELNIDINFGAACLILLLSAPWTPLLWHWWIILPSAFWVLKTGRLSLQEYEKSQDLDYCYRKQMEYLQMRVGKGERPDDNTQ